MKKDLILITSHCDTTEKEEILRNLISGIQEIRNSYDFFIVSHTMIPEDICSKCTLVLYDSKNEILTDPDLRSKPWFNPGDTRPILSVFTGFFNTHLAIWRMVIIGNSIAKNLGYQKIHHLEYDCDIKDFSEFYENSNLLEKYDCVTYTKTQETVTDILFGTYQAYRIDSLSPDLLCLDENKIKESIRKSDTKSPEEMLFNLLHTGKNGMVKSKKDLDQGGNFFGCSHKINRHHTAWCLPFFDELTNKICFIVWNSENEFDIEVSIVYNEEKYINLGNIKHMHWKIEEIGNFNDAKTMTVILNGKIRNHFNFEEDRENFRRVSFREKFNR